VLFERSELHSARPFREAQGSPKGRVLWALSFGYFSCAHKKSNKKVHNNKWLATLTCWRLKIIPPRLGRTTLRHPAEVKRSAHCYDIYMLLAIALPPGSLVVDSGSQLVDGIDPAAKQVDLITSDTAG